MNQEKIYNIIKWVGVFLIIFLAVISIKQLKTLGDDSPMMNIISVNGKGEAISIPDIATFSFAVNETAKTVKEAQEKATMKIDAALKAVKAGGVLEKDIKTSSYSINPHYEYNQGICTQYGCPNGKNVLTGYDVNQTIEVKIRDLAKAGELFDSIGKAGIQTVNGLQFAIDDLDSVKAIAREEAIANAKEKAQKIAKDLGLKLVKITSFYDSSDEQVNPYAREMTAMSGDIMLQKAINTPEIPVGEQKVTARVSISYEIR